MYETLYENITNALVSDEYVIIPHALPSMLCDALSLEARIKEYKKAAISASNESHLDENRRRGKIHWIDGQNDAQREYLDFTNGLMEYLNRSLYLGLSYYESHFALYEEGDFYEKHVDAFKTTKNRVVTTVLYLNENWDEKDGGELIIYDDNDEKIAKVIPEFNTLVVFLSEKFPHEALESQCERYSIAGWFRVDSSIISANGKALRFS